ncbi:Os07g0142100, partial [Oryza sativa Japonica Group]
LNSIDHIHIETLSSSSSSIAKIHCAWRSSMAIAKSECERLAWALLLESNLLVGNRRSNGDDDDDDVDVAPAA